MNLLKLSWKNILHKPLNTFLSITLLGLSTGLISFILLLNTQLEDKFEKNLAGVDLVIGAKGSPLQLILSGMFHIDAPTGNIKLGEAKPFLNPKHPLIKDAVPLSLGDTYKGYRIVGTTPSFLDLYKAKIRQGRIWESDFEVCVGANVAEKLELSINSNFKGSHGLVQDGMNHEHDEVPPFKVVGILAPTGTVADQLVLTSNSTFWHLHETHEHDETEEHNHDHDHEHEHEHGAHEHEADTPETADTLAAKDWYMNNDDKEITLILTKFKNRNFQTLSMQRNINENTGLQAATPALEINRLYLMMGIGSDMLKSIAFLIMLVSGLSVFVSLYTSLKERKYELALMRVMGASRLKLFALILLEGVLLSCIGTIIGLVLSHIGMNIISKFLQESYRYTFTGNVLLQEEILLVLGTISVGIIAAFIPAWQALKTDISKTLSE